MNPSIVEVTFKVFAEVDFGEEVYVSGNVPALGAGDLSRAIPLVTSSMNYPWWMTKEGLYLPSSDVKYRYCIFSGGKFSRWETNDGAYRNLNVGVGKGFGRSTEDKLGDLHHRFPPDNKTLAKLQQVSTSVSDPQRAKIFSSYNACGYSKDDVGPEDSAIVVSYFLPVILSKNNGSWSATWDKEALLSLKISAKMLWIGSVRYQNAPIPIEEEEAVASVLAGMNCYPVFINQTMHYQFYDLFCKQNLWLVMHHVADVYGPLNANDIGAKGQQNLWFNFSTVHKLFREKVLEIYQQGYLIWIHGFHLMLLPNFLRRRIPQAKIGYYFHTPFPSSELWRTMPRREDLLRGILGANQIGFHLYEYARHFLTVCHRVLGYSSDINAQGMLTVNVDGREVVITCIHVGVDMPRVTEVLESNKFVSEVREWKARFSNKIVISGIDRLEKLKGIPLKLMALDQFLEENPQYIGKLVFTLIGISAGERGQDYRQTQHDVKIMIGRLNEKYSHDGNSMFYFEERHDKEIRLAERLAYFATADILMMTATRDGLNRYPMEFTLARKRYGELVSSGTLPKEERLPGASLPSQGLVIISEFISSARVMRGSMVVNPWRVDEVKVALKHSLEMKDNERADRNRRNLEFSTRLTSSNWANNVLRDLKSVEVSTDPDAAFAVGFGMQFKVMNLKSGFLPLDTKEVCKSYRNARHRLILLDWGGTLTNRKADKYHAYALATGAASRDIPSDELKAVLESLCADVKNVVFVVSGKESHIVNDYFGSFKGLGLAGEHGFYYKWPKDTQWQSILETVNDSWKESCRVVMDIFVQRTHGTYIEVKGNALIWQFSDADPEFGFWQSKELEEHLHLILANYPVEVIRGGGVADGYIEVRPTGASKGTFLDHAMQIMKSDAAAAEFVLAIGDDNSDEPMFDRIAALLHDQPNMSAFGVTVGKKPTAAKAYVDDPAAVIELLNTLSKTAQRDRKFFSAVDLPSQAGDFFSGSHSNSTKNESFFPSSTTGGGLNRATSVGYLPGHTDAKKPERVPSSPTMKTSLSNPSLSIGDYMHSINETNEEDGDEGIFF